MNRRERRAHSLPVSGTKRPSSMHGRSLTSLVRDRPENRTISMGPDCDSEVEVIGVIVGPSGIRDPQIEVRHDDSCPWYADLKRDLA
jgi:hypothetical protein